MTTGDEPELTVRGVAIYVALLMAAIAWLQGGGWREVATNFLIYLFLAVFIALAAETSRRH